MLGCISDPVEFHEFGNTTTCEFSIAPSHLSAVLSFRNPPSHFHSRSHSHHLHYVAIGYLRHTSSPIKLSKVSERHRLPLPYPMCHSSQIALWPHRTETLPGDPQNVWGSSQYNSTSAGTHRRSTKKIRKVWNIFIRTCTSHFHPLPFALSSVHHSVQMRGITTK